MSGGVARGEDGANAGGNGNGGGGGGGAGLGGAIYNEGTLNVLNTTFSANESAVVAKLRAEQKELRIRQTRLLREIGEEVKVATAGMESTSDEARAKSAAIYEKHRDKTWAFVKENRELSKKLEKLVPASQLARQALLAAGKVPSACGIGSPCGSTVG